MDDDDLIRRAEEKFPFVACGYARELASRSSAFRKQMEVDVRELDGEDDFPEDPFGEDSEASGCFGLKQRFPDRVLIMASNACFMNCRYCTRRGLLKHAEVVRTDEELSDCLTYIREHPQVRDVLISGGDPLVLPDDEVMRFIDAVSSLEQIEVVRLCTRAPCVNPARITEELADRLGANGKVWVNTQFNSADELTPAANAACERLVKKGIPVSCQTVMLAGVNDSAEEMLKLFRALQCAKVRPYYVFQCDPVAGISHFRVPLEKVVAIEKECAEKIGGLGLPRFVADIPGSKRKVPVAEVD